MPARLPAPPAPLSAPTSHPWYAKWGTFDALIAPLPPDVQADAMSELLVAACRISRGHRRTPASASADALAAVRWQFDQVPAADRLAALHALYHALRPFVAAPAMSPSARRDRRAAGRVVAFPAAGALTRGAR